MAIVGDIGEVKDYFLLINEGQPDEYIYITRPIVTLSEALVYPSGIDGEPFIDLADINSYFKIVNKGTSDEYILCRVPIASKIEIEPLQNNTGIIISSIPDIDGFNSFFSVQNKGQSNETVFCNIEIKASGELTAWSTEVFEGSDFAATETSSGGDTGGDDPLPPEEPTEPVVGDIMNMEVFSIKSTLALIESGLGANISIAPGTGRSIDVNCGETPLLEMEHKTIMGVQVTGGSAITGGGSFGNADTLDGYHATAFPRKAENAVITGMWAFLGYTGFGITEPQAPIHNAGKSIFEDNISFGGDIVSQSGGTRLDGATNHLTLDSITVRKAMRVYELIVNSVRGTNGSLWVSDTAKIDHVEETATQFKCFIDDAGGDKYVPFVADDIVRHQKWTGNGIRYYAGVITEVGSNYFVISKSGMDGTDTPQADDTVVRFGNLEDTNRQGALYLTSSDDYSPYLDVIDGVDSYDLTGKVKVRLGRLNGLTFNGTSLSGYGLYGERVFLTGAIRNINDAWALNTDGSGILANGLISWTNTGVLTISGYATNADVENELQAFEDNVLLPELALLQEQVDQKVEFFFQASTNPIDTTGWGTTEEGNQWYQIDTMLAFRWDGTQWVEIKDADAIQALADASKAQDTADGKRRSFVYQPYAPYDVGDLWTEGENGDLKRCMVAREEDYINPSTGAPFNEADWELATSYTDDTEAFKKSTRYIHGDNPANDWETDELKEIHKFDEWIIHAKYDEANTQWLFWDQYPTLPAIDSGYIETRFYWDGLEWNIDETQIDGKRIITGTIISDKIFVDELFAQRIYLSGAKIGGFNISENYLKLGTQVNWNPNSATEGLIMGLDTTDSKYKFFVGNVTDHLIWNGSNLIISGYALIGDETSTTTLGDLGTLNEYFEIVNPGQANEYIKAKAPFASVGEIQAWSNDGDFPPSIWDSLPIASSTVLGAVKLSSDFTIDVNGVLSVNGDIGSGFDETANYTPSGIWNFTGTLNYGGNEVATQSWATGQFEPAFTKNSAFNKNFAGNGIASTVARSDHNHNTLYHVKGGASDQDFTVQNLVIHGTVNHWVADVITVDDARLQLNRTQDAATVASGIDVYDGASVVSSLLYGTDGRWKVGGQNIATESWVGNNYLGINAKAADADKLDGLESSQFLRSDVDDEATGLITFNDVFTVKSDSQAPEVKFLDEDDGDNFSWAFARASDRFDLEINGVDTHSFLKNGNVGIGTTSPSEKLEVNGNSNFIGDIILHPSTSEGYNGTAYLRANSEGSEPANVAIQFNTMADRYQVEAMRISPLGDVSIGISEFGGNLNVANSINIGGSTQSVELAVNGIAYVSGRMITESDMIALGNVGIGTASPSEKLDVNGNIKASGDISSGSSGALVCPQTAGTDTTTGLALYGGSDSADIYGIQFMKTSTTGYGTHGSVTGDWATYFNMSNTTGRGWIFRTNGGGNKASIDTGGNIVASGEVTAYSDARLKNILNPTTNVLDRINALTVYDYTRKDTENKKLRTGLLAQDLQKQFPQFVSGKEGKDSYLSINYSEYAATVATKGIQELYTIIQQQQQQIDELEKRVN